MGRGDGSPCDTRAVVETVSKTIAANAPDWWGVLPPVPTGVTEDRYVAKMQLREVNDVAGTVSGQFVFHHANYSVLDEDGIPTGMGGWPVILSFSFLNVGLALRCHNAEGELRSPRSLRPSLIFWIRRHRA